MNKLNYLITLIGLCVFHIGFSQTQKNNTPNQLLTNTSRYKIDFELKDFDFTDGDSTLLEEFNIDQFIEMRLMNEDIEIYHSQIGQTIILYSVQKSLERNISRKN